MHKFVGVLDKYGVSCSRMLCSHQPRNLFKVNIFPRNTFLVDMFAISVFTQVVNFKTRFHACFRYNLCCFTKRAYYMKLA